MKSRPRIIHVVSVSSGKDSDATLTLALNRCPPSSVIAIFCDTGNEHEEVDVHLDYIERRHGIKIVRLKNDFSDEFPRKRMYIARDVRVVREYDTVPVLDADGSPVPKRDGKGNIVMRKVRRGGVEVLEPAQKTKKVGGGGVRCAGATNPSAGRWSTCTQAAIPCSTCACSRAGFRRARPSSVPSA